MTSITTVHYDPIAGTDITRAVTHLISIAPDDGEAVMDFNGTEVRARLGDKADQLVAAWRAEVERKAAVWRASPEHARQQAEMAEREARRKAALQAELATAPATMTIRDQAAWDAFVANNPGMGAGILRYAERWARLMEGRLARGEGIAASRTPTSHLADDEGMSGMTHSFAVGVLRHCWLHGEELYALERGGR